MVRHVNAFVFPVPRIRDTVSTSICAKAGFDRMNVRGGAATQSTYFQSGESIRGGPRYARNITC